MIDKCDANFIPDFYFVEIPGSNLLIGSYPQSESDVQRLKLAGATAVFDCQTYEQIQKRGLNQERILSLFKQNDIKQVVNFPIEDLGE